MSKIKCSVCIPTYKRPEGLNRLLSQLLILKKDRIAEIIIAVTGNIQDSFDNDTFRLLRALELDGYPMRITIGLDSLYDAKCYFRARASQEILLILDDDVVLSRKYLKLLDHFKEPSVAAVSGVVHTPVNFGHYDDYEFNPVTMPGYIEVANRVELYSNFIDIKDKYQIYPHSFGVVFKCECLFGSAMFIHRDLLCPDKTFYNTTCYLEEVDYTYGLYQNGFDLICDSSEYAYHLPAVKGGFRECEQDYRSNVELFLKKYSNS